MPAGKVVVEPFDIPAPRLHNLLVGAMPTGKAGRRDWSLVNSLTYKSVRALRHLLPRRFDYFLRSNANLFLDLPKFALYLPLPVHPCSVPVPEKETKKNQNMLEKQNIVRTNSHLPD